MHDDNELEDGAELLQDVRQGPPKERKRPMAPVYIDETQLPPDFELGVVEEKVKVATVDEVTKKIVERELPFRGVKIHLVSLSIDEQIAAVESAGMGAPNAKVRIAQMKHAMRKFNGRPIDFSAEEQDTIYEAIGMKGQAIVAAAWARVSQADLEAVHLMNSQFRWER